jgi:uncharacterized protein (DUF58 family)
VIRPTTRALAFALAGFALAALPVLVDGGLWPLLPAGWVAWLALLALDALRAPRARALSVAVDLPGVLAVGDESRFEVRVDVEPGAPPTRLTLRVDVPDEVVAVPDAEADLAPDRPVRVTFPLRVRRRGSFGPEAVWLRWTGPLGLASRTLEHPVEDRVAGVARVEHARKDALRRLLLPETLVGARSIVGLGEGSEFESMREHVAGMDRRGISWRASARHRRLIQHEFRAERNHQVVVAIDTGRLMGESVGGVPRLDLAVEAALRLAHVALAGGDRVGLFAFDARPRGFVPPRAGVRHGARLERFAADLAYGAGETNYTLGLSELSARLTRRTFVVILTDFVDSITAELMVRHGARLARRHLTALVALRDPELDRIARAPPDSLDAVQRAVVADDLARERRQVCRTLERRGVFVIDAEPSRVGGRLVDRYLHVKRRELVG